MTNSKFNQAFAEMAEALATKINQKIESLNQVQEELKGVYRDILKKGTIDAASYHAFVEKAKRSLEYATAEDLGRLIDEASDQVDQIVAMRQQIKRPFSVQIPPIDRTFRSVLSPIETLILGCQDQLTAMFKQNRDKFTCKYGKFSFSGQTFYVQEEDAYTYILKDPEKAFNFAKKNKHLFNLNTEEASLLFRVYGVAPGIERVATKKYVFKKKTAVTQGDIQTKVTA